MYVSNTNTNEIFRYDADSGKFHDVFIHSDNNGGLLGPKDLLFSSDGNYLYVSSFITNEILRYDGNTGKFIDKIIYGLESPKRPMKMLLDPTDKHLYVTSVDNNEILKYDVATANLLYRIGNQNLTQNEHLLSNPLSIALNSDNFLYVSNTNTNEIFRYDADSGKFHDVFIHSDNNGGLLGPKDLLFSSDGNYLYVSSFITNEILRYDGNTGKFIDKFISPQNGELSNPTFILFGSDEFLYVSSSGTGEIIRFDKNGNFLDVFIKRDPSNLTSPTGISLVLKAIFLLVILMTIVF